MNSFYVGWMIGLGLVGLLMLISKIDDIVTSKREHK